MMKNHEKKLLLAVFLMFSTSCILSVIILIIEGKSFNFFEFLEIFFFPFGFIWLISLPAMHEKWKQEEQEEQEDIECESSKSNSNQNQINNKKHEEKVV